MQALSAAVAGFFACHILTCRFLVQEGVIDKDRFAAYLETAMTEMAPGIEDQRPLFSLRQLIPAGRAPRRSKGGHWRGRYGLSGLVRSIANSQYATDRRTTSPTSRDTNRVQSSRS